MANKISFVNREGFSYLAEVRQLTTPAGAFSFAITSVLSSAKNPEAEQAVVQITLDQADLIALRDVIDAELQS